MRPEHRLPPAYRGVYAVVAVVGCIAVVAFGLRHGAAPTGGEKRAASKTMVTLPPLRGVVVVLDPGHGGVDSGAICRGCREDAVNYRLTATVAAALRAAGVKIAFTVRSAALDVTLREGKAEPPLIIPGDARLVFTGAPVHGSVTCLYQRAAAARPFWEARTAQERASGRGLYFLSIHHDDSWGTRGARVAYDRRSGPPPSLATVLARRLAETRRNRGGDRNDPRALGVLNPSYNPVRQRALLEAATISNAIDRELARSRQWRWRMAHLVADAIRECEGQRVTAR